MKDFIARLRTSRLVPAGLSDKALRDVVKKSLSTLDGVEIYTPRGIVAFKGIDWNDFDAEIITIEEEERILSSQDF